jgi:haloacetate dehalogenase
MTTWTDFQPATVPVGDTTIFVRHAGRGQPLLLLHGFPQTHRMWHAVAPALAEAFTVVCADLTGYGDSGKPPSTGGARYTKRAMAQDLVQAMEQLGHRAFAVAGHDRGARVAYRMALDHPERVRRLALFDVVATADAWQRADARTALAYWPWVLLAQPEPLPERFLQGAAAAVVDNALSNWGSPPSAFDAAARQAYVEALSRPEAAHAICEEYRAAATLDREHDEADLAQGRRIECPTLVLWARGGPLDQWYREAGGPLALWSRWCRQLQGEPVDGGHFFPEASPELTAAHLGRHVRGGAGGVGS